ncbi:hypothetical protein QF001_004530 [Paraburkholderia youngii]
MVKVDNYRQGSIEIIKGRPEYYAMSNAFEVANCVALVREDRRRQEPQVRDRWRDLRALDSSYATGGLRSPKAVLTKTPPRHHRLLTTSVHLLTNNGPIGTIYSEWNT